LWVDKIEADKILEAIPVVETQLSKKEKDNFLRLIDALISLYATTKQNHQKYGSDISSIKVTPIAEDILLHVEKFALQSQGLSRSALIQKFKMAIESIKTSS